MKQTGWSAVLLLCLLFTSCAVVPIYKHPNVEQRSEPVEPVGTYNASLQVPWYLNFNSVGADQAANCRRYLVTEKPSSNFRTSPCQGIERDNNFVALALSGGGSRSAALSTAIMWELEQLGIMQHVDVISAVSGGAQAAALYALQRDQTDLQFADSSGYRDTLQQAPPIGSSENATKIFENNLTRDWVLSLFLPWNMLATLFTNFDRTDVMANTFANKYYGRGKQHLPDKGLRFRDINPKRPNLLLNAVDMSFRLDRDDAFGRAAGECFAISYETFRDELSSDLHHFPIAQAVMATNTVPGMHQYYSLREFGEPTSEGKESYVHLADGSIRDHLALVPINAMLRKFAEGKSLSEMRPFDITQACQYSRGAVTPRDHRDETLIGSTQGDALEGPPLLPKKVLVIVVDAGVPPRGVGKDSANTGSTLLDKIFPVSMVVDAFDTALDDQRALRAIELLEVRNHLTGKKKIENGVWGCANEHGTSVDEIASCLSAIQDSEIDAENGVLGPSCCPVIAMGIHNYMKFAADKFGPINVNNLDSDKTWGADLITLECMADNDYGRGVADSLYSNMRTMNLGLSLNSQELKLINRAARTLVDEMLVDFCDKELKSLGSIEEIKCRPTSQTRQAPC